MSLTVVLAVFLVILGSLSSLLLLFSGQGHRRNGKKRPIPGPLPLPVIGNLHMLTALPHRGLQTLAKKYGAIMSLKLGQVPTIVVSSPQAAELFLKTHDTVFAGRPKGQVSENIWYGTKGMAFTDYSPYWRDVRKLCNLHLLNASKVESFAALRREEVRSLVAAIRGAAAAEDVVDVSRMVEELSADIACRMILGRRIGDEKYGLRELVDEAMSLAGAFNVADYLPYLAPLDLQGYTKKMKKLSKSIDEVLEKIIMEHEQAANRQDRKPDDQGDFVDVLLSFMDQPMNPNDQHDYTIDRTNIKAILLDMIAASFDTSSVSIEWIFSELLKNPRVMKKLQRELESVIGMDQMVEEKDLLKLAYLEMVVKESLRLHPVAPLLVPHQSMEDITVEGYYIPKKSRIIINAWAIGRDPNAWSENAEEFYPERFIGSSIDLQGHHFQLLPFGSGRRGCPGLQMGMSTVCEIVAQLVHCFHWELPSGVNAKDVDMTERFSLSMGRANHLRAKPTYRLS